MHRTLIALAAAAALALGGCAGGSPPQSEQQGGPDTQQMVAQAFAVAPQVSINEVMVAVVDREP